MTQHISTVTVKKEFCQRAHGLRMAYLSSSSMKPITAKVMLNSECRSSLQPFGKVLFAHKRHVQLHLITCPAIQYSYRSFLATCVLICGAKFLLKSIWINDLHIAVTKLEEKVAPKTSTWKKVMLCCWPRDGPSCTRCIPICALPKTSVLLTVASMSCPRNTGVVWIRSHSWACRQLYHSEDRRLSLRSQILRKIFKRCRNDIINVGMGD